MSLILLTVSCGLVSFSPAWLVRHYSVYPLGDATRKTQLSSPWKEIIKPGTPHFQASLFALTINTTSQQKRKVTCTSYVRTQFCRNFFHSHVHQKRANTTRITRNISVGDYWPPLRCKWRAIPLEYMSFILSRYDSEYMLGHLTIMPSVRTQTNLSYVSDNILTQSKIKRFLIYT